MWLDQTEVADIEVKPACETLRVDEKTKEAAWGWREGLAETDGGRWTGIRNRSVVNDVQ